MSRKDGVLALLVVVVWGLNFVVIKVGLHNMPPLMLAGLRFMLVAFPAIFFVARPKVPLNLLLDWLRWCYRHRRFLLSCLARLLSGSDCMANNWRGSP
ncbi:EamA family transporter [Escherichia coli]|uniref:EamA family transporter n=1 Tax=Escherichia coli TaxID=562 RepID=UPI0039185F39